MENKVIHRINHTTEATAVAIGIGASFQPEAEKIEGVFADEHAGIGETSIMLYLRPELVKMERAEKPELHMTPRMRELFLRSQKNPELFVVFNSLRAVPEETKKGGASHELSSNGIWSTGDPKTSTRERGERNIKKMVDSAVKFIEAWKQVSQ